MDGRKQATNTALYVIVSNTRQFATRPHLSPVQLMFLYRPLLGDYRRTKLVSAVLLLIVAASLLIIAISVRDCEDIPSPSHHHAPQQWRPPSEPPPSAPPAPIALSPACSRGQRVARCAAGVGITTAGCWAAITVCTSVTGGGCAMAFPLCGAADVGVCAAGVLSCHRRRASTTEPLAPHHTKVPLHTDVVTVPIASVSFASALAPTLCALDEIALVPTASWLVLAAIVLLLAALCAPGAAHPADDPLPHLAAEAIGGAKLAGTSGGFDPLEPAQQRLAIAQQFHLHAAQAPVRVGEAVAVVHGEALDQLPVAHAIPIPLPSDVEEVAALPTVVPAVISLPVLALQPSPPRSPALSSETAYPGEGESVGGSSADVEDDVEAPAASGRGGGAALRDGEVDRKSVV